MSCTCAVHGCHGVSMRKEIGMHMEGGGEAFFFARVFHTLPHTLVSCSPNPQHLQAADRRGPGQAENLGERVPCGR